MVGGLRSSWSRRKSSGWTASSPSGASAAAGKSFAFGGDDGLRAAPDRRREHVPVVLVGQGQAAFEFLPAGDQRVVEGFAHLREALGCVDSRVDLLGGRLGLGEDAVGPQRAVQALLRDAQRRVGQCDGHEHAGVEHCGVARHDYEAPSGRAARLRAFFRAAA